MAKFYKLVLGSAEWEIHLPIEDGKIKFSEFNRGYDPSKIIPESAEKVTLGPEGRDDQGAYTRRVEFEAAVDGIKPLPCQNPSYKWVPIEK